MILQSARHVKPSSVDGIARTICLKPNPNHKTSPRLPWDLSPLKALVTLSVPPFEMLNCELIMRPTSRVYESTFAADKRERTSTENGTVREASCSQSTVPFCENPAPPCHKMAQRPFNAFKLVSMGNTSIAAVTRPGDEQ